MARRFLRQDVVGPVALNLNGVALDTAKTSNAFSVEGYNTLVIYVNATRVAYTALAVYVELTPEDGSVSNWYRYQDGTTTLTDYTAAKTTATNAKFIVQLGTGGLPPINASQARITISSTAGGGTDTAVVTVVRAFTGG